jgi:hypothetical protein
MAHAMKFVLAFVLLLLPAVGQARTERFTYPDIKEDFCGARISAQYCKWAAVRSRGHEARCRRRQGAVRV